MHHACAPLVIHTYMHAYTLYGHAYLNMSACICATQMHTTHIGAATLVIILKNSYHSVQRKHGAFTRIESTAQFILTAPTLQYISKHHLGWSSAIYRL
jgi:hypothetical protein